MKKEIIKVRKQGNSGLVIYKFDNTPEDQKKARELLASGKAPMTKTKTLGYILPQDVPSNLYDLGEFKQKEEDRKWLNNM